MSIGKRVKESKKKRDRIIQATVQLLLKKGGSGSASTTDICAAARLTRPTLYHYFGSKRNLLLAVHMESIERTLRPYMEKAASLDDPLKRLIFMVRTYTEEIICVHPELRVLIHDSLTMKDTYFREVKGVWKKHYALLRDTIDQLQKEGRIDSAVKPAWGALFVLGMLTWVTFWFDFERKGELSSIADQAEQMVLHGLGHKISASHGTPK